MCNHSSIRISSKFVSSNSSSNWGSPVSLLQIGISTATLVPSTGVLIKAPNEWLFSSWYIVTPIWSHESLFHQLDLIKFNTSQYHPSMNQIELIRHLIEANSSNYNPCEGHKYLKRQPSTMRSTSMTLDSEPICSKEPEDLKPTTLINFIWFTIIFIIISLNFIFQLWIHFC